MKQQMIYKLIKQIPIVGVLLTIVMPVTTFAASDSGLSLEDIETIKVKISIAKGFIGQFKPYFDDHVGRIDITFLDNTFLRDQFVIAAGSILAILVITDIILILAEQAEFKTFFPRLLMGLTASTAYVIAITAVVVIANSLMKFIMGTNDGFVEFTQKSMDVVLPNQDLSTSIWNTIMSRIPFHDALNVTGQQTKFVIDILLLMYTIAPFIIGFAQVINDFIIMTLFIVSPFVAIFHIHGIRNKITSNFWAIFFDCIIAKIAFTVSYRIIGEVIKKSIQESTGGLDIGKGFYYIALFMGMGAITLAIREVFNISGAYQVRGKVESSASKPTQVFNNSTNTTGRVIYTLTNLRK